MHTALAGTLAGLLHVVSGPDHLVAVAPLALKRPLVGLKVGLTWGVGHASGVILVGMAGVVLRTFVDIHVLSRGAEFTVGFVLIGVGLWAIFQMRRVVLHRHPHTHDRVNGTVPRPLEASDSTAAILEQQLASEPSAPAAREATAHAHGVPAARDATASASPAYSPQSTPSSKRPMSAAHSAHAHLHVHGVGERHNPQSHQRHHTRGSFLVGLVHGAAGTGHLLGVLPSLALPPLAGSLYLGSYGIAAVVAMGAFGLLMGCIGSRLQPTFLRSTMLGCGVLAIAVGVFWLGTAWQGLG